MGEPLTLDEPRLDEDAVSSIEDGSSRGAVVAAIVLTGLACLPIVVALFTRTGRSWLPIADDALVDLRARDVFSGHPPLVGAYSRYGWSHPGPAYFWFLAPFVKVAGAAPWGLLVGNLVLQLVAIGWTARLAWTSGRLALVATVMPIMAVTYAAIGPLQVLEPWNPYAAVPWFVLFVVSSWQLATGQTRRLVGWLLVASFLVQLHVGYVPLIGAAAVVIAGSWWLDRRAERPWVVGRRRWITAAVVTVVVWLPPIIEQLVTRPGNLVELGRAIVSGNGGSAAAGYGVGLGLFAREFQVLPPWAGGGDPADLITDSVVGAPAWLLVIPVIGLLVGWLAARASGRRDDVRWIALTAVLSLAGVVALARTTDALHSYLFLWRIPLALFVLAASGWAIGHWAVGRIAKPAWLVPVAIAVSVLVAAIGSLSLNREVLAAPAEVKAFEVQAAELVAQAEAHLRPGERVQLRLVGRSVLGLFSPVVNELDRRGEPLGVDAPMSSRFGSQRVRSDADTDKVWLVVEPGWLTSMLVTAPGAEVIARGEPVPAIEGELVQLQRTVFEQLQASGHGDKVTGLDSDLIGFWLAGTPGVDQASLDRLGGLNAQVLATGRCRCSIVAFPVDQVPSFLATLPPEGA